jgi:hypothetical protein
VARIIFSTVPREGFPNNFSHRANRTRWLLKSQEVILVVAHALVRVPCRVLGRHIQTGICDLQNGAVPAAIIAVFSSVFWSVTHPLRFLDNPRLG